MSSIFIYLLPVIIVISVVGIKLIFNYFENKKIMMVLEYIDKRCKNKAIKDKIIK